MKRIVKNKLWLYITEFFCGMSVMAVELGASRLLAPYFSSSQIVWTIIIATIMIAMALGNVYGGRSADANPDPTLLYRRILLASIWIAAIPFAGKYLILGITGLLVLTISSNLLVIAAFLACMIIFVFPCFLLGTCTPSLARYTVTSAEDSGRTVGMLGAFNTAGSIIGTFLPTFVTIPATGTAVTFLIFSGILLVISLVYFLSPSEDGKGGRPGVRVIVGILLFVLFSILGCRSSFAFWEKDLLYEGESVYNYLQVKDTPDATILSTNVLFGVQSITMKDQALTGMYYDYALAAPVMAKEADSMLILGMGTGTYARQCLHFFDNMTIQGVEIDEKITELSHRFFDAPEEVEVITYDGRAFLAADTKKYDVIMVDAYQDITIPFQMSSVEFFRSVREHLTKGGVMVVNMNMRSQGEDGINTCLADTISSVFPSVLWIDVPGSTNRELFALTDGFPSEMYEQRAAAVKDSSLAALLKAIRERLVPYEGGDRILTDDRAPVELLGMRAIDEIVKAELAYYRELFLKEGFAAFF